MSSPTNGPPEPIKNHEDVQVTLRNNCFRPQLMRAIHKENVLDRVFAILAHVVERFLPSEQEWFVVLDFGANRPKFRFEHRSYRSKGLSSDSAEK